MSKEGIEVHIYDVPGQHGDKGGPTLHDVAACIGSLGRPGDVRVLVDTGGTGAIVLHELQRLGLRAEAMPKVPGRGGDELDAIRAIIEALRSVPDETQHRIMNYVQSRFPELSVKNVHYIPTDPRGEPL